MKNMILLFFLILSLLPCGQLVAQYQFTTFDESAGLPDNSCRGMDVDDSGTLWVGTQEGLAKWNGTGFVHVPIDDGVTSPFVSVVKAAPDGNIWVGYLTFGDELGLSVIDPDGNLIMHADSVLSGQPGTWVFDIEFGPDSLVYVGHTEGISTFDGSEWVLQTPSPNNFAASPVHEIYFAEDNSLWVGTVFGLAHRQTNGIWENFYTLSTDIVGNNIRTLEFDDEGQLWIGTSNGLSVYDGENFTNYGVTEGLPDPLVRDIAFDESGNAWLMTDDGFSVYDGVVFQNFKTYESPFIENLINNVLLHPELGTWMTTREGMVLVEDMVSSTDGAYFDLHSSLDVFPNPTPGLINLNLEQGALQTISVFSSQGQLLQRFELGKDQQETTLDISFLPAGNYWLQVETGDGLLVQKVVRQ